MLMTLLIDRAMGLFGRGGERRYLNRMRKASDLFEAGELAEARPLYERLVVQSIDIYGPDAEQTLLTRGALANTYGEEAPERACRLPKSLLQWTRSNAC